MIRFPHWRSHPFTLATGDLTDCVTLQRAVDFFDSAYSRPCIGPKPSFWLELCADNSVALQTSFYLGIGYVGLRRQEQRCIRRIAQGLPAELPPSRRRGRRRR